MFRASGLVDVELDVVLMTSSPKHVVCAIEPEDFVGSEQPSRQPDRELRQIHGFLDVSQQRLPLDRTQCREIGQD